ncbi:MAG: methionyl-tRNA formyltransferase [Chlamydiia bacterium]
MLKIVFFATPELAVGVLDALCLSSEVLAVVTMPDKPRERGGQMTMTPVKKRALELGLAVFEPLNPKEGDFVEAMERLAPDLFIVFAYGHILRKNLLDVPRLGSVNIHTSLLPYYRGAAPIERAILAGEVETGISIMKMDIGMDTGGVYAVERVQIPSDMDAIQLRAELARRSIPLLVRCINEIEADELIPKEQDHSLATFAPKIQKEELILKCETKEQMSLKVRGLTTYGGVKFFLSSGESLKVWKAKAVDHLAKKEIEVDQNRLYLRALNGSLELLEVQIEGKKKMSAREFINGYASKIS